MPPLAPAAQKRSSEEIDGAARDTAYQEPSSSQDEKPVKDERQPDSDSGAPAIQKRRRVTRACDECRKKVGANALVPSSTIVKTDSVAPQKIRCDGKQPCTHCTVYSYGASRQLYPPYLRDESYLKCRMLIRPTLKPS